MAAEAVQDIQSAGTASDVAIEMPRGKIKNPMPETVQEAIECARDLCSIAHSSVLEKNASGQVVNNVIENLKNLDFQGQDLSDLRFKYDGNIYSLGGLLEKLHTDSEGNFDSFKSTATEILRGTVFDENTRFDHDEEKNDKIKQFLEDISGEYKGGEAELVNIAPVVKWAGYDLVLPVERTETKEGEQSSGAAGSSSGATVTTTTVDRRQIGAPQGIKDASEAQAPVTDISAGASDSSSPGSSAKESTAPEAEDKFKPLEETQFGDLVSAYKRWANSKNEDDEDLIKERIQKLKDSSLDPIPPRRLLLVSELLEEVAEGARAGGESHIYNIFSRHLVEKTFEECSREYPSEREVVRSQSNLDFLQNPEKESANPDGRSSESSIEDASLNIEGAPNTEPEAPSLRERTANLLSGLKRRLSGSDPTPVSDLAAEPAIEGSSLLAAPNASSEAPIGSIAQPAIPPDQAPNLMESARFKRMVESFPTYGVDNRGEPKANLNDGTFAIYEVEDGQSGTLHLVPNDGWADETHRETLTEFFNIETGKEGSGYGLVPAIVKPDDQSVDSPTYTVVNKGTIWVPQDHALVSG